MSRPGGVARPLGFLVLMLGLGLRMESCWDAVAWLGIVAGTAIGGAGLLALGRGGAGAFVPRRPGE